MKTYSNRFVKAIALLGMCGFLAVGLSACDGGCIAKQGDQCRVGFPA